MQAKIVTAALLGFVLIAAAACSGGGDDAKISDLEERIEAAEEKAAEAAKKAAAEEAARKKAEADAKKAEEAKKAAEKEAADAEKEAADAQEAEDKAEAARQAAEAERQRLATEAEKAEQRANAAEAAIVLSGLATVEHTLAAMPSYREAANLTTPNIDGTSAGSSGRWFKTSASRQSAASAEQVALYSDVEAPKSTPFKDSGFNLNNAVVNAQGMVLDEGYNLGTGLRMDVASGSFDRTSSPPKSFDMVDRGQYTTAQDRTDAIQAAETALAADDTEENREALAAARASKVRNIDRHPYRYTAEASGTLSGASGRFRCGSDTSTPATSCTVQNTGGGFVFSDLWRFVPSSGTVGVRVADSEYMWFGWWSTETDTSFTFNTNHGGVAENTNRLTSLTGVSGTATYNGVAVGQYAISGTLVTNQGHGEFTAKARLEADFGTGGGVTGSLTNFSGHPDWEVTLREGTISGGAVTGADDTVTWSIAGDAEDGGAWEADFYSNLPSTQRANVQPYGIAGTFEAEHGDAAKMAGAFGAHRQ